MPSVSGSPKTIIIALTALHACLLACGGQEPCEKPGEVINAFFSSVEIGDQQAAFKLLDGKSRAALERIAKETSSKTGKAMKPHEFIVPLRFEKSGDIKKIKTVKEKGGKETSILIKFTNGTSRKFPLTREGNCYIVHIDI